jgi:ATP-dependent DNA helicase RecQ
MPEQLTLSSPLRVLKDYFGYDKFRPLQSEIIETILAGENCLVLMPTGGGKSICYQVPAIASDGICIVVSPLISLMRDQVDRLVQTGIQARALTGSLSRLEQELILDEVTDGKLKLLYVAPERLQNEKITDKLFASNLSFFAIDEAHCISQWGNDFRPSYRNLSILKENCLYQKQLDDRLV